MTLAPPPALLPAGLRDLLPPESVAEAKLVQLATALFASHGYELVKPPLVEFEETLLSGSGQALARQTFRLMDPLSQQMMAVRRDMTMQVARIAASRLGNSPRPLRLAYSGEVLRVSGTQLFPQRQFCQVGCELIGVDTSMADAEIVLLAAESLAIAGIEGVSFDLNLPPFIPRLLSLYDFSRAEAEALAEAIERRDLTAVGKLGREAAALVEALITASGPVDRALAELAKIGLPAALQPQLDRLRHTVDLIRAESPDLTLTVDLIERRGFRYHTALTFTAFVQGLGEVGRGGRYRTGRDEPSIGFTFLVDALVPAMPRGAASEKVYIPLSAPPEVAAELRRKGLVTVRALENAIDPHAEAERLGCTYIWTGEPGWLKELSHA